MKVGIIFERIMTMLYLSAGYLSFQTKFLFESKINRSSVVIKMHFY